MGFGSFWNDKTFAPTRPTLQPSGRASRPNEVQS